LGNSKIWQTFYGLVWPFSIRQKIRHFRRDKFEELSEIFFLRGPSATFGRRRIWNTLPFFCGNNDMKSGIIVKMRWHFCDRIIRLWDPIHSLSFAGTMTMRSGWNI
jgi:hypothetical protein